MSDLREQGRFPSATTNPQERRPQKVMKEFQRARESLTNTTKRLGRKYGEDELLATVIEGYEKAKGINYEPPAKKSVEFISIAQAAKEFGVSPHEIARWVSDGTLDNVGKWEHPQQPGKGVVLVDPREVQKLKEELGVGKEVAEPNLLTLKQAAETHDLPYRTLQTWHQRGRLPEKGREVFPKKGGSKILVDEKDVIRLKHRRTPKSKTSE